MDPYAPTPSFWDRQGDRLTPLIVFGLTVLLTVIAFPPFHMSEAAYAMLVPASFWAYLRPRLKVYLWTMFAAQAVSWIILLSWLHHVTWLGLFLLGPLVGAWVGVWFLAAWWTFPRMIGRTIPVRLLAMLGLAGAWVVIEWTRTWLLSGFPWLPLAASQWQRVSILQVAAFTGAGGVSFVLVAVNIGFAAYAHRLFRENELGLRKRSQEFFLALFLLLACLCVHVRSTFNRGGFTQPFARVAFVQPDIPQEIKWDESHGPAVVNALEATTLEAIKSRPDLILWPEASTPWALKGDDNLKAFVESLAKRAKAPLVVGSIAVENKGTRQEQWFNGAFVIDADIGLQSSYYAKRHLVPFGEYVPIRPLLGWLDKVVPVGEGDYVPGTDASPLVVTTRQGTFTLGPLICYEDIYPNLARNSVKAGAEVLVVLTNNGWFGEGGAAWQHAAHAVLRAVETRRPVLRCGNAGWSGWIDEFGNIRATLLNPAGSIYFRGTQTVSITRDVRWIGRESFYVEHGDWFVAVCAALGIFGWLLLKVSLPAVRPNP